MNGVGIYKWLDGRIYEGEFVKDERCGFGVHKWADKREYKGYWSKGE
jgi:hypothetical protein